MERWKELSYHEDFNQYYEVSNKGNIRNFKTKKMLKMNKDKNGYLKISLFSTHLKKHKSFPMHRLVASTFIENISNKKEVNHIDGVKDNNNIRNLEWVTRKENINHGYSSGLYNKTLIPVVKLSLEGELLQKYKSAMEASRDNNVDSSNIYFCCKNIGRTCKGFLWMNEKDYENYKEKPFKIKLINGKRKVIKKDLISKEIIEEYLSLSDASVSLGKKGSAGLFYALNNSTPYEGFLWEYSQNI